MPSDLAFKAMNTVHRVILGITRNRVGWSAMDMPVLQLTTTGRRSGQPRKTMLSVPYREGSTLVVVASRGGDDRHPAWFLNLRDHPEVQVRLQGGAAQRMRARVADDEERRRLWPLVTADHKNYADYQKKTSREIPIVLLEPVDS